MSLLSRLVTIPFILGRVPFHEVKSFPVCPHSPLELKGCGVSEERGHILKWNTAHFFASQFHENHKHRFQLCFCLWILKRPPYLSKDKVVNYYRSGTASLNWVVFAPPSCQTQSDKLGKAYVVVCTQNTLMKYMTTTQTTLLQNKDSYYCTKMILLV